MKKMRDSKGGGYEKRGAFFIRVTVGPQKRQAEHAPWATNLDETVARGRVAQAWVNRLRQAGQADFVEKLVELAAKGGPEDMEILERKVAALAGVEGRDFDRVKPAKTGDSFEDVGSSWTSGKLHRLYPDHIGTKRSAKDDEYRLAVLCDVQLPDGRRLGDMPMRAITLDVADAVMSRLDATRARRDRKAVKPLRSPSRRQYAQVIAFLLGAAAYPMRIIGASPIPRGWLPTVKARVRPILYPGEELQTMRGTANLIHWRMFFGFLSRSGFRADEAAGLQLRDVHFDKRVIELDENKTDDPRAPTFDVSLFRALTWWRDHYRKGAEPTDLLFVRPDGARIPIDGLADEYRETFLRAAHVEREKLFRETDLETKVCTHSCRANFVTYSLAEGRTETWIADRTGHKSSTMINRYRRRARGVVEAGLGSLTPLDVAIPEVAAALAAADAAAKPETAPEKQATKARNRKAKGPIAQSVELRTFNP